MTASVAPWWSRDKGGVTAWHCRVLLRLPLGPFGVFRDIAYGAPYLATDEADWSMGVELVIDGGITAKQRL